MTLTVIGVALVIAVAYALGRWGGRADARAEYEERVRELHGCYLRKCAELEGELQAAKRPGDGRVAALAKGRPYLDAAAGHLAAGAQR